MAKKLVDGTFACTICGHRYPSPAHADGCRDSHQLLYIPMSKTELNRLINALILDKVEMVPEHLVETLQKYARFQTTILEAEKNGAQN
jgi:hypothetical protein